MPDRVLRASLKKFPQYLLQEAGEGDKFRGVKLFGQDSQVCPEAWKLGYGLRMT